MSSSFIQVTIKIYATRLISFYLLYYMLPCSVLAVLMFTTFIIPPENGERIGFCSSLLIALSVYLLLFSEMLPSSRHVSLLGVFFVVIYLETAMVLLATVLVLKAFHSNNPVPKFLRLIYGRHIKKKTRSKSNKIKPAKSVAVFGLTWKKTEAGVMQQEEQKEGEVEEVVSMSANEENQIEDQEEENQEWSLEDHQRCWSRIARSLDRIFFWFFVMVLLLSVFYIITKSNDIVKVTIF